MATGEPTTSDDFRLESAPLDPLAERRAKNAAKQRRRREKSGDHMRAVERARYQRTREKRAAQQKAWREANPEKIQEQNKRSHEKRKDQKITYLREWRTWNPGYQHGLTRQQYEDLIASSGGRCEICKTAFSEITNERPCVDHCHKTGKIRGILCNRCNWLLGQANDDPKILRACIRYLAAGTTEMSSTKHFVGKRSEDATRLETP